MFKVLFAALSVKLLKMRKSRWAWGRGSGAEAALGERERVAVFLGPAARCSPCDNPEFYIVRKRNFSTVDFENHLPPSDVWHVHNYLAVKTSGT